MGALKALLLLGFAGLFCSDGSSGAGSVATYLIIMTFFMLIGSIVMLILLCKAKNAQRDTRLKLLMWCGILEAILPLIGGVIYLKEKKSQTDGGCLEWLVLAFELFAFIVAWAYVFVGCG